MGATCVLPACFLCASCMLPSILLPHITVYPYHYCLNDGCFLRAYFYTTASKLNWTETHTILPTFLGSTQEAHMGASCVLPSVASLMGRSVYGLTYGKYFPASPWYSNVISSINNRWSDRQTFRSYSNILA